MARLPDADRVGGNEGPHPRDLRLKVMKRRATALLVVVILIVLLLMGGI